MRQKENIVFTIDKTRVTEHEYITVRWECGMPDQVSLTVEDGTRQVTGRLRNKGDRSLGKYRYHSPYSQSIC